MGIQESLAKRRTYYNINKELPVAEEEVVALVENTTELVPDAFNMKSARVIVVTKAKQDELWDAIYEAFGGKVAREKIDSFKAGYGTLLYFYDEDVVKGLQEQFPLYAAGARMTASYPVHPLLPGHALAIGVTSYDGGVYYGITADRPQTLCNQPVACT